MAVSVLAYLECGSRFGDQGGGKKIVMKIKSAETFLQVRAIGLLTGILVLISGCMMQAGKVHVTPLASVEKGPKEVTFLNNTEYLADMSIALAEVGFTVKPMPSQQEITELQSPGRIASYNEASTRWGLTLTTKDAGGLTCALTDSGIYNFTLMLTDIANNQLVLVLKQKGSDGPCTTIKPVFDTLAEQLLKNW